MNYMQKKTFGFTYVVTYLKYFIESTPGHQVKVPSFLPKSCLLRCAKNHTDELDCFLHLKSGPPLVIKYPQDRKARI